MNGKYFLCVILYFLFSISSFSQNFEDVDKIVLSYSNNYASPEKLADQIKKDFKTDLERIRAAYTWISYFVSYDIEESGIFSYSYSSEDERLWREKKFSKKLSKRVINRRRAVCEGYSYLFKEVCDALNIETIVVTGASKTLPQHIGRRYNSNHAWNIVKINNQEHFIDTTWGSQKDENNRKYVDYYYFMTRPDLFILNHYPDNYNNSLLEAKITKQEFIENPILYNYKPSKIQLIQPFKGILFKGNMYSFQLEVDQPIEWIILELGKKSFQVKNHIFRNGILQFKINIPKNTKAKEAILFIDGIAVVGYKLK